MIDNGTGKVAGRGGHTNNCNTLWIEEVFHESTSTSLFDTKRDTNGGILTCQHFGIKFAVIR